MYIKTPIKPLGTKFGKCNKCVSKCNLTEFKLLRSEHDRDPMSKLDSHVASLYGRCTRSRKTRPVNVRHRKLYKICTSKTYKCQKVACLFTFTQPISRDRNTKDRIYLILTEVAAVEESRGSPEGQEAEGDPVYSALGAFQAVNRRSVVEEEAVVVTGPVVPLAEMPFCQII